jgi:hypothetical protein
MSGGSSPPVVLAGASETCIAAGGAGAGAGAAGGGRTAATVKHEQVSSDEKGVLARGKGGQVGGKRIAVWWQQQQYPQEGPAKKRAKGKEEQGLRGVRVKSAGFRVKEEGDGAIVVLDDDSEHGSADEHEAQEAAEVEVQVLQQGDGEEQQGSRGKQEQQQEEQGPGEQQQRCEEEEDQEDLEEMCEGDEEEEQDVMVVEVEQQEEVGEEAEAGPGTGITQQQQRQQQQECIDSEPVELDLGADQAAIASSRRQDVGEAGGLGGATASTRKRSLPGSIAEESTGAAGGCDKKRTEPTEQTTQQLKNSEKVPSNHLLNGTMGKSQLQQMPQLPGKQMGVQQQQQHREPLLPKAMAPCVKVKAGARAAAVAELLNMGFTEQQAERALWATKGNVQRAVEWCLSGM